MKALQKMDEELAKIPASSIPRAYTEFLGDSQIELIKQAFACLLREPELLEEYAKWLSKTTGDKWERSNLHAEEMVLDFVADRLEGKKERDLTTPILSVPNVGGVQ